LFLALIGSTILWLNFRAPEPARTLRSFLPPPAQMSFDFTGDFSGPPVIARDGSAIAFCARNQKDRDSIWVQSLTELTPKKLDGTESDFSPMLI
jgi:hypothetical protein